LISDKGFAGSRHYESLVPANAGTTIFLDSASLPHDLRLQDRTGIG